MMLLSQALFACPALPPVHFVQFLLGLHSLTTRTGNLDGVKTSGSAEGTVATLSNPGLEAGDVEAVSAVGAAVHLVEETDGAAGPSHLREVDTALLVDHFICLTGVNVLD